MPAPRSRCRPSCLAACALAAAGAAAVPAVALGQERVVEVRGASVERIGGWSAESDPTLGAARRAFGRPTSSRRIGDRTGCTVRWGRPGLRVVFANFGGADACSPAGGRAQIAILTGPAWRTARGLRVGDGLASLRRLYPRAARREPDRLLVTAYSPIGTGGNYAVLAARIRDGRVLAFFLRIGAAGD